MGRTNAIPRSEKGSRRKKHIGSNGKNKKDVGGTVRLASNYDIDATLRFADIIHGFPSELETCATSDRNKKDRILRRNQSDLHWMLLEALLSLQSLTYIAMRTPLKMTKTRKNQDFLLDTLVQKAVRQEKQFEKGKVCPSQRSEGLDVSQKKKARNML